MFNAKKTYFKEKLANVRKMIWDLEFKRFKTAEIREEIRQEYDNLKMKIGMLDEQIKNPETVKKLGEGETARLGDDKTRTQVTVDRLEKQMAQLDMEIRGAKPSADYPDGVQGINLQLESLRELEGMVKEYLKDL